MFQNCPKCNAWLDPGVGQARERCPACGLVFAKYLQAQRGQAARAAATQRESAAEMATERAADHPAWLARLLRVPAGVNNNIAFYGCCIA